MRVVTKKYLKYIPLQKAAKSVWIIQKLQSSNNKWKKNLIIAGSVNSVKEKNS